MAMLCMAYTGYTQHTLIALVKDAFTRQPLAGATVTTGGTGTTADSNGIAILRVPTAGTYTIRCTFTGYRAESVTVSFPRNVNDTLVILMQQQAAEMGDVVVASTRSNRSIQNIPTRVEFINGEELEEKGNMRPGDIRMMLNESTGIQTQQVSATSANSSIRIQGLDGRYTQILKDGFPLYAGFSGGLGLLQTPPLDLKQVEIVKGSASTLYGGGAIAGLVNLISKAPSQQRELRFLLNGTSAGGFDGNGFYGQRWGKLGLTLYGGYSSNKAYDPSAAGFSAIPKFNRYVLNPKLFIYFSPKTSLSIGLNTMLENRTGGDMQYLRGHGDSTHSYFEENKSQRASSQVSFTHSFNNNSSFVIKNAISNFKRTITVPGYVFDGNQSLTYTELAYNHHQKQAEWVAGVNVYTDNFKEQPHDTFTKRDYNQTTYGAFVQNSFAAGKRLQIETGLRGDYILHYGWALLPRVSALVKFSPALTSRIGGGLGYKTPTIFTEETERVQFKQVLPVSPAGNRLEKSYGVNADINHKTTLAGGKISFSINQLFFFTRINRPLVLDTLPGAVYKLINATGYLDSKGFETNVKLGYGDIKLYIGYTFTDAHLDENGLRRENPLTARHRLNNVLVYEQEDKWKFGLEAYYFSSQLLTDGSTGKPYWTFGFMGEKIWEHFSLFANFENFTDTRQTRFGTIYTGSITNPVFKDIYAPLDGFVVNGGIKVRL